MVLEKISGPVIGAIIGYCTNYIAVKMLFYPRKEIYVMGHKLPFTPGAIPKGKDRLAKAVGSVISNTLLTEKDIKEKLLSPEIENIVVDKMMEVLSEDFRSLFVKIMSSEEEYESLKEKLVHNLTERVLASVHNLDLENVIMKEGSRIIKEKTDGTMLALFVSDELVASILHPFGAEFVKYIEENGNDFVKPEMEKQIVSLETESVVGMCNKTEKGEIWLREKVTDLYHNVVEIAAGSIMKYMNISGIVEDKISAMRVEDLEKLVLSVMKKELDMIVNLGAFVGALLGIFNMFF